MRAQIISCIVVTCATRALLLADELSFVERARQVLAAAVIGVGKELATIVERMERAGPDRGLALLYNQTRSGHVTLEEFVACIQQLVFLSMLDIEDREDELAAYDALLLMTNLPSC